MKSILGLVTIAAILLVTAAGCAGNEEEIQPAFKEGNTLQAVQGKWQIERVSNRLCRGTNCTTMLYTGAAEDYFEFKADSAFLQRAGFKNNNSTYRDRFKADYSGAGSILLSNFGWSARFKVLRRESNNLVLESTYTGTDPSATFTDTYYLYR